MRLVIVSLLLLAASASVAPARGDSPLQPEDYRALWGALPADYAPDQSVVVLSRKVIAAEDTNRETTVFALRDASRRDEVMNVRLYLSASAEIRKIEGWSYDLTTGHMARTTKKDIHEEEILKTLKLITMVIPGSPDSGLVGIRIITEDSYYPAGVFSSPYPLREGYYRVMAPGASTPETDRQWRRVRQTFMVSGETDVTWEGLPGGGWKMEASFLDVPPRPRTTYLPLDSGTVASVRIRTRPEVWSWWAKFFGLVLEDLELPKPIRKQCGQQNPELTPKEKLAFVVSFLENPANFRLEGLDDTIFGATPGVFRGQYDPQKIWSRHRGSPMDKAVFAHLMLRELGMESHLAFGASRFSRDLDPLWDGPGDMDVVLLHIPLEDAPKFLWHLSDPTVPLGSVGRDLNDMTIVMDKSRTSLWMRPRVSEATLTEYRSTTWSLEGEDRLAGITSWSYGGEPWLKGIDPWNMVDRLDQHVRSALSPVARLANTSWSADVPDFVANEGSPLGKSAHPGGSNAGTINVEIEAELTGLDEDRMEFRPFPWNCPELLEESANPAPGFAILMPRSIHLEDRASLGVQDLELPTIPDSILVENPWGSFSCSMIVEDSTLVAARVLRVRAGEVRSDQIHYLTELAEAWRASTGIAVELSRGPAPPLD